jgi:hypothetical protein
MSNNKLSEEEQRQFLEKEICVKYKDVINFNPMNSPLPSGLNNWNDKNPPTKEYKEILADLVLLTRFIGMKISEGCPELKENMIKRCATLSIIFEELAKSVAIDGWHLYGLTSELHNNTYMSLNGKQKIVEVISAISKFNEKKIMEKSSDYVQ